ncbi:sigma-54 interaction domain-containing protein [Franzmannia pantelleriensis]|uniref:sigma-54 interaction domain-containing protein n=1 Tax=Franzmannia pantelleriensis TaxID=48727 RepID=UPI0015A33451|nr:sigma-54 dependent transcriptional regulator [Halomonas pantelleriensis]
MLAVFDQNTRFHKLIKALSSIHDWEPCLYGTFSGTINGTNKAARVGVVLLDKQSVQDPQYLTKLKQQLCGSRLYWLALLDTLELPSNGFLNSMLDRFFHCYQMLPCSVERVHYLLAEMHELHVWQRLSWPSTPRASSEALTIIGSQQTTSKLFDRIKRFASVDAPVMISGETGTGKELAAHAIHLASSRANGPFIAVNCGALPEGLAQSELYGYEKGAFTGAYQQRKGYIEAASGGTLFLDEIGDLPLPIQVNLLRFLESQRMMRVGGRNEFFANVRIIAATHVDLYKAVVSNTFRDDLYHRLNVLNIQLLPLRERISDIQPLAEFFFRKFRNEGGCCLWGISQEALDVMQSHTWPGNIRELMNRMRRAILHSDSPLLLPIDMGLEKRQKERYITSLELIRNQAEYRALCESLTNNSYDLARVASELMISKITLYRLIEKHNLKLSS